MKCKYCNKDSKIRSHVKSLNLYTLECGHSIIQAPEPNEFFHETYNIGIRNFIEESFKSSDGRTPYPYQSKGIEFAKESNYRCLIADEMGLGKTIQALGTLRDKELLPALIIVKSSLKMQWFSEIIRWLGIDYLPQLIEDSKIPPVPGFNTYITSYDLLRRFKVKKTEMVERYGMVREQEIKKSPFYNFPFKTIILDECQSIKSITSSRTEEVQKICKDKKAVIALSGTPIKNHAGEYFPILNILRPDKFPSLNHFYKQWVSSYNGPHGQVVGGLLNPERFKDYTKDFIIRRERKEVMPELPTINRVFFHVDFETEKMKKLYQAEENELIREMESNLREELPANILGIMSRLRHIVGVSKVPATVERISDFLISNDRKLVVFCHHEDVMKSIFLLTSKWCIDGAFQEPLWLHSGLNSGERYDLIGKFKSNNHRILIASTLAASEGLNLQFCADCIIAERQWNPANEEQAEGRFIRIGFSEFHGDRSQVDATYMIASNTIDEYFTELVEKKRAAFKATMNGEVIDWNEGSLFKELVNAILLKGRKNTTRGF